MHKYMKIFIVIVTAVIFKNALHYLLDDTEEVTSAENKVVETPKAANRIFTIDELSGTENRLLLAILGNVYDVTKGEKHYKPDGSYGFFVGKDASRAYVTGDFKNDLNDNLDGLSDAQVADIFNWKKFYDDTYTHVGILVGRFYDSNGEKTQELLDAEEKQNKNIAAKELNTKFNQRFPSCNTEWTQEKGLVRVWCTPESGGVTRSWSGYPRLVRNPNTDTEACACVNEPDLNHPNVKPYSKCDPKSTSCSP